MLIDPNAPATRPCLAGLGPRLKSWKPSAAIPTILALAKADALTSEESQSAGRAILGYIVRRTVCGLSRRNLYGRLASLCRQIQRDGCTKRTVMRYLADPMGIDGLWPANARFGNHWVREPLYRQDVGQRVRQLLREIAIEASHLDHIMPQD